SPYLQLSESQLQKYLPGASRSFSDPEDLNPNNPEHKKYFCPIHTKEWKDIENEKGVLHHKAQEMIDKIKKLLETPEIKKNIKPDEKSQIDNAIAQLQKVVDKSSASPNDEGKSEVSPEQLQNAIDQFKRVTDSIIDTVKN